MRNPLAVIFLSLFVMTGCSGEDRQASAIDTDVAGSGQVLVVASNYPLYYFANRIAESVTDAPEIVFPEIDGDPAHWVPNADQVASLQSAEVVLLNGAGAEAWTALITIDEWRLFDTSAGFSDQLIPLQDTVLHQHGPEGEHSHVGTAFTTWLDPQLAIAQANAIADVFVAISPDHEQELRDNLAALEQDLNDLDARLAEAFAQIGEQPVVFSHPVYQYLQRRYFINGKSVHWEPDEEPTNAGWISLQQVLISHPASLMVWEDNPMGIVTARLANADIKSVTFHTAANRPSQGDYLSVMRANAARLAAAPEM